MNYQIRDDGVHVAFDLILEEIGSVSSELKAEVKHLVDLGKFDDVSELSKTGKALEAFQLKVVELQAQWTRDFDEKTRTKTTFPSILTGPNTNTSVMLYMVSGNAYAEAEYKSSGVTVLQGSTIRKESHASLGSHIMKCKVEALKNTEIKLADDNSLYRVNVPLSFGSPSAAACFVAGCSVSGPREWQVKDKGMSLKSWLAGNDPTQL